MVSAPEPEPVTLETLSEKVDGIARDTRALTAIVTTMSNRVLRMHQAVTLPLWLQAALTTAGGIVGGALVAGCMRGC